MAKWPKDSQTALIKFYGDPATGEVADQLVRITPPFQMFYDGKPLKTLTFHKKAAAALLAALTKVWDYYDHSQAMMNKLGVSKTAGTFNPRYIRGSTSRWSNHAYGAAIDINAEQNGFNVAGNIPPVMIAAFKSEGARWGGDYKGRKDPMHFEFCDSGEPTRSFEQWLDKLGVKPKATAKVAFKLPPEFKPRGVPATPDLPDKIKEDFADKAKDGLDQEAVPVIVVKPIPTSPGAASTDPSTPAPTTPPVVVLTAEGAVVQGDPEIWHVQRRLKAMMYNPGGMDGVWGGLTAGAITGFINDRPGVSWEAPASVDQFRAIFEPLKLELSKAEGEHFTRPIAPERATATASELATKLPEVDKSIKAERVTFWGSIAAAVSTAVTGVSKFFGDAVEWLNPVKEFVGDLPWPVWVGGALAVSGALYYVSRMNGAAKDAATQAYQEGSRS